MSSVMTDSRHYSYGQRIRSIGHAGCRYLQKCFSCMRWNGLLDDEWDIRSNLSPTGYEEDDDQHYGLQYSSWRKLKDMRYGKRIGEINSIVFLMSTLAVLIFFTIVIVAKPQLKTIMPVVLNVVAANCGWFYVVITVVLVMTLAYLAFSKYGSIRLGYQEPEYPLPTWIAMMFSAGVGIALVYYGTSQPLSYYRNPPLEVSDRMAYDQAVPLSLYIQGYISWPCFSFMGLTLAYLHHVVGLPLSIRSIAAPLLGKYTYRWPGHMIDVVAVVGTVFGIAATLGVGTTQLMTGIHYAIPTIPNHIISQLILLLIVGGLAMLSVLFGISRGMAVMANINMILASIWLMCFFFINLDPERFKGQWFPISHVTAMIQNIGGYFLVVSQRAFRTAADNPNELKWMAKWSYFFSGWQLTWSPFVSSFLAAISKGRTIRSYIIATILAPHVVNLVWFTIMGRVAIITSEQWNAVKATPLVDELPSLQVYKIIDFLYENGRIWYSTMWFLMLMIVVVLVIFIVTSADSATYVIVTINAGGSPSRAKTWLKLYWLCSVLLVCGLMLWLGGLDLFDSLEAILIVIGLPLGVLMMVAVASLLKMLELSEDDPRHTEMSLASYSEGPANVGQSNLEPIQVFRTSDQYQFPMTDYKSGSMIKLNGPLFSNNLEEV